jgi:hypothetical protein
MSFKPEIVSAINEIYQKVIMSQMEPATLILPVQENTLPNSSDFRIYLDHPRLPTPTDMTLAGNDVMAHNIGDFAYECQAQPNAGAFHLLKAAGVFSVGFKEWLGELDVNDNTKFDIVIRRNVEAFTYVSRVQLTGATQAQVFLNPGDMFWLNYVPENENDTVFIGSPTEFLITRISRNPYYIPQFPFIS